MTERTIEVEETVTREQKIKICDYCGEGEEDDNPMVTYGESTISAKGWETIDRRKPLLHIHEKCRDEGLQNLGPNHGKRRSFSVGFNPVSAIGAVVSWFFFSIWRVYRWPAHKITGHIIPYGEPDDEDIMLGHMLAFFLYFTTFLILSMLFL